MSKTNGPAKTVTIRASVDPALKAEAETILHGLGLSHSDAIRYLYKQITIKKGLPFDVHIPNATTRKAFREADAGKGTRYANVDEMFEKLGVKRGKTR
jgi:DNA-damage-inducible protein J